MYLDWIDVSRRTAHARCTKCGSNGGRSGCIPASSGSRFPFRVLQLLHAVKTFVQALVPPRDRGTRWSRVRHSRCRSSCWLRPQNWQRQLSRAKRNVLVTWRRKRRGTWTNFTSRMTAGLGICKRSLRTTEPSPSTISALRSITRRKARRTGTMVRGSNEAFSARQRTAFSPAKKRPSRRATSGTAPYATQPPKARQELGLRPRPRAEQLAQLLQLIFHGLTRCPTRRGAPLDTILPGAELRQRGAQPGMDPPGDGLRHTVERHPGSFGFADQFPHEGVALPER